MKNLKYELSSLPHENCYEKSENEFTNDLMASVFYKTVFVIAPQVREAIIKNGDFILKE